MARVRKITATELETRKEITCTLAAIKNGFKYYEDSEGNIYGLNRSYGNYMFIKIEGLKKEDI